MGYVETDFKNCAFNPLVKEKVIEKYPSLIKVSKDDKLLRYILIVYDDKSPVVKNEKNLTHRKTIAAELAGYNLSKDERSLLPIFDCSNEPFVKSVVQYLILFVKSNLFTEITVYEQLFVEYTTRLLQPVKSGTDKEKDELASVQIKSKLREELKSIRKDLDTCYQEFFKADSTLEKANKQQRLSPENPFLD